MQYRIIGFAGLMGAGKTTAANRFMSLLRDTEYTPRLIKFAAPLYDIQKYAYERTYQDMPVTKDRKLLQFLGTDWGRAKNENMWINIWELDVKHAQFFTNQNIVVIADDLRFDNEAKRVREMGGAVINVESSTESRSERIPLLGTSHSSEQGIDPKNVTATIYNNNTTETFLKNVDYLFQTIICGNSQ